MNGHSTDTLDDRPYTNGLYIEQMSLSTFTDNILILAVENCLIRKVPEMFQSTMVTSMDDDMLARLASETRSVREEREMLQQDLEILDSGLRECKRYRPREPRGERR